jgi:uncharacterized BrkB/YihY/UPF0761 family membrane protein
VATIHDVIHLGRDVVVKSFIRLALSFLFTLAVLASLVLTVPGDAIGPH